MDTVEIQADTVEEVALYSAKWASDKLKCSVVKIDSGISIDASLNSHRTLHNQCLLHHQGFQLMLDFYNNRMHERQYLLHY